MSVEIKQIQDYPAIKKLAASLHGINSSQQGAAIMIGAGFSRSAARHVGGDKKLPLWSDFTKKLAIELNPSDANPTISDPLRLAEEYRSYFGQAALNDKIRFEIDDNAWHPGDLYDQLLSLPWSDVMTTNWDTLLERAAKNILNPFYTPVTKSIDFTWAQQPRIVKLHGTIGTTDALIAAQEDYRTYPEKFAPFVNFARQVFIEKELCLLGFSGDDPNFLHWSGWVRDNLAGHARKIYLVGVLKLSAARRKHLETLNIVPVDLWDVVKSIEDTNLHHKKATELFLKALKDEGQSKITPQNWNITNNVISSAENDDPSRKYKDHEYGAKLLKEQIPSLQRDRLSYPGWLICPPKLTRKIKYRLIELHLNKNTIDALAMSDKEQFLYEIAWLYSISSNYIAPWLAEELTQIATSNSPTSLNKAQQMEIALLLVKNSRYLLAEDDSDLQIINYQTKNLISTLETNSQYLPDCIAEIAYHNAIVAQDKLNYIQIEAEINKIDGDDLVWKLRKSSLLMFCGKFDEAKICLTLAHRQLRERYRYDQNSISILSRLSWAHFLLKAATDFSSGDNVEALPIYTKEWLCDPWDWIENIRSRVNGLQEEYLKNKNPIKPKFALGRYRDNTSQMPDKREALELYLELENLRLTTGVPFRSGDSFHGVRILADSAEKITLIGGTGIELWDFMLAIHSSNSESSPSIESVMSRIGMAITSEATVNTLFESVSTALLFWQKKSMEGTSDQKAYSLSILRVLIEALSRLTVRLSDERAIEAFKIGIAVGNQKNLQHHWICESLEHLLSNSLASIPKDRHGALLAQALSFPLPSEAFNTNWWPNPIITHINERTLDTEIESRISKLIEIIALEDSSRPQAIARLLPLTEKEGYLTNQEKTKLSNAIWGKVKNCNSLPETGLLPHALLLLPSPDKTSTKKLIQNYLYEHGEEVLSNTQKDLRIFPSPEIDLAVSIYSSMAYASTNSKTQLFPTNQQALKLFQRLVAWRPKTIENDFLGSEARSQKHLTDSICLALSYAIVPALSIKNKTIDAFKQLQDFHSENSNAMVLPSLAYFSHLNEDISTYIVKQIQLSLASHLSSTVSYGAITLLKLTEQKSGLSSTQLERLITRLIHAIDSGKTIGLQQLLWVSGEIYEKKLINNDIDTLISATFRAFEAANYININPSSQEAINASLIREACVKLARTLLSDYPKNSLLEEILNKARIDPLPEVRFALSDS